MDDLSTSRRGFVAVAGLAAAAAAAGASPAAAQAQGAPPMESPTQRAGTYPRPPFPVQSQPFPGLTSRLNPRPDHGETSYRGSGKLAGMRALITGGDSGIGRATAIAYAREGALVAINHLPYENPDAQELIEEMSAEGLRIVSIPGDLRDERFCNRLIAQARRELGGLNILVNNAGRAQTRPSIEAITTEDWDATMKTNIYAPFWLTRAAVPDMRAGDVIINTTSALASIPIPDLVDYVLTKAAMLNFTGAMAKQLAPRGIRVNAVAPGLVWTPIHSAGGSTDSDYADLGRISPMGRPAQPAEIAPLYVTAADPLLSYSTGQIFAATGGSGQP
ncbi:MAG: SDR family oxidoreductase [Phycisphaerales bacterium]|nr:SDR family oxidoreductase [Hyphomonadaceae bacterium]